VSPAPLNPSELPHPKTPIRPETEFEQMVADSVGRALPLFGQSFFMQPPSTFSPVDRFQVPSDYTIGPGDELQIRVWGQVEADLRVIVDRTGQIYIPQVGGISVAGLHYVDLEEHLKRDISRIFKNFSLTATIGRLRAIQVVVVGNARYPGTYTISSLSTLVNAIFSSGGPGPQGSLRHIQVRRNGATITDFDFYDLLIQGDKSKDIRLLAGDVLYIPHVGPLVAIAGTILLLFHVHGGDMSAPNAMKIMKHIEAQHRLFAATGFGIAISKGLAEIPQKWQLIFSKTWPALLTVLGILLIVYTE